MPRQTIKPIILHICTVNARIGKIKPLFTQAHLPASPRLSPMSPLEVPLSRRVCLPASAGRTAHGAGAPPRGGGTGIHHGGAGRHRAATQGHVPGAGRPAADAGRDGVPHGPDQAHGLWPGAGAPGGGGAPRGDRPWLLV